MFQDEIGGVKSKAVKILRYKKLILFQNAFEKMDWYYLQSTVSISLLVNAATCDYIA